MHPPLNLAHLLRIPFELIGGKGGSGLYSFICLSLDSKSCDSLGFRLCFPRNLRKIFKKPIEWVNEVKRVYEKSEQLFCNSLDKWVTHFAINLSLFYFQFEANQSESQLFFGVLSGRNKPLIVDENMYTKSKPNSTDGMNSNDNHIDIKFTILRPTNVVIAVHGVMPSAPGFGGNPRQHSVSKPLECLLMSRHHSPLIPVGKDRTKPNG